ncbi:MAG: hypothetical protein A3K18_08985 [Lentisphaerae bacterium RIFOXYA12_64_32]|nr:MAG: hypothetical protein A3K18_08985 [Lentisphaerae bacterium RIFOXYA12_64_32]
MHTFTPLQIGSMRLANRLVRSATGEGAAEEDVGCPTEVMAAFYDRLAAGGVGLVITGHTAVSHEGRCGARMTAFTSDTFIPAFARVVAACHRHGTPVVCQLNHGGRQVNPADAGVRAVCPSAVQVPGAKFAPAELASAEIERIVADFGAAARRCREAGFDGVQIHAAHGYLVAQFNSPLTNRRTDRWGGSPEKRRAFMVAVYEAMRGQVGTDYPILVKQNVSDFHPEGLSEAEAVDVCRLWDKLGIAAIELSGGIGETIPIAFRAQEIRQRHEAIFFEAQACVIRKAVHGPVILTGGIRRLDTCERLLGESVCDGIGLCRPLIREPDLPRQWQRRGTGAPVALESCAVARQRPGSAQELCRGTQLSKGAASGAIPPPSDGAVAVCTSCGGCKSSPERCNYCGQEG